jgi:V8-like Glu-specific endopeptidase
VEGGELLSDAGEATLPIIGGVRATSYPEAALVDMDGGDAFCSGTVIAPYVALTAGHCVYGFRRWKVTTPYNGGASATSTSSAVYDYRSLSEEVEPRQHDVGLIFLSTPIRLSSYPKIAQAAVSNGTRAVDIGRIRNGRMSSTDLYSAAITVRSAAPDYPLHYESREVIQAGDSGGPVMLPGASPHTVIAVNSGAGDGTQVVARVDLVSRWIAQQIAAHGGTGASPPPNNPPPPTCNGTPVTQPINDFSHAAPLGSSACGNLPEGKVDWFTWSISGATNYRVKLTAAFDAQLRMWKQVGGLWYQVANTSDTEFAHTSSGAGVYAVAVFSPSGTGGPYQLTLAK